MKKKKNRTKRISTFCFEDRYNIILKVFLRHIGHASSTASFLSILKFQMLSWRINIFVVFCFLAISNIYFRKKECFDGNAIYWKQHWKFKWNLFTFLYELNSTLFYWKIEIRSNNINRIIPASSWSKY